MKKIFQECPGPIERLDIRFFEELPLLIRADIVEKGIIINTPDKGELTEYFFFSTRIQIEEWHYVMKHASKF